LKKIVFIPPNGSFKKQDFSILRISKYLFSMNQYELIVIYIDEISSECKKYFHKLIQVNSKQEIINKLNSYNYDYIFHRSWMHSYSFAAELAKRFDKVIVYIKDWEFAKKDVYRYLFGNSQDFDAIELIFKKAYKVLSHFSQEQIDIWEQTYKIDVNKFIFFPDYCDEDKFIYKKIVTYKPELIFAGNISPTSYSEDYFPGKAHLRAIRKVTKQGINITFYIPPMVYDIAFGTHLDLYRDLAFENRFNRNFFIIKGGNLDTSIIKGMGFGFFELESSCLNDNVIKYAVVSKFAFYLEAQIPMLVNKRFQAISKIIKKYNLGIVFENDDLNTLKEILEKVSQSDYERYLENIKKFRKYFTYNENLLNKVFL